MHKLCVNLCQSLKKTLMPSHHDVVYFSESHMKAEVESAEADIKIKPVAFLRKHSEARLRMNIPYLRHWPQALALMSLPPNAPKSLHFDLELVDSMWHYAGDKSVDYNWYSKRLMLLGLYKSTELAMMQDSSADYKDTWEFLDRRFVFTKFSQFIMECFPRFCFVVKTSADKMILPNFDIFSHDFSFFQPNWHYLGLKTQLVWKKTAFMLENVKNLQNHVVGRRFHNDTKPWKTFHCAIFQTIWM